MRIAVNTISTKKQSGGAYQIAYNFLKETLKHQDDVEWYYITSSDVDESVGNEFESIREDKFFVFPTQPDFKGSYNKVRKDLADWEEKYKPDVIYTISSPCYFRFKTPEVMRFANAWVTNPNKYAWRAMPFKDWLRMKLYRINQLRLLRKAKYIITQSKTVGKGLVRLLGLPEVQVKVVPNVLPKVFNTITVDKSLDPRYVDIACVAAPFPHKNLIIIPKVLQALKEKHGITNVRIHLTIPEDDVTLKHIATEVLGYGLKGSIVNHGRCPQKQLSEIYNHCSICLLPSLLETFSATSLEAMYFGLCIVATDFEFNREVIQDAGLFYQPDNAGDAADKIATLIINDSLNKELQEKMKKRLSVYSDYGKHFEAIKDFLVKVGEGRL